MLRVDSLNSYSQSAAPTSHFTMRLESVEYLIFKSPLQLEVYTWDLVLLNEKLGGSLLGEAALSKYKEKALHPSDFFFT